MLSPHQYLRLLRQAGQGWMNDNAPSMGAALAFYSAFAMAPVLLILSAVAGLVFGAARAREALLAQVDTLIGPIGREAVSHLLDAGARAGTGIAATVIGGAVLLIGASSVMLELQHDLDVIWRARPRQGGFWEMLSDRLLALVLILGAGALLLVSLIIGTALNALIHASTLASQHAFALVCIHMLLTLIVFSLLFAMLFKWLPNVRLGWREVWRGAFVTALLFTLGQLGIGYYLGQSSTTSAYAAVASLLVLLLWLYYGAQIFLFGAELVHANVQRSRLPGQQRAPTSTPAVRTHYPSQRAAP